jgi:high frequency lysogenization protein
LAGVLQSAYLVDQIAHRGLADHDALQASIGSILKIDADDVLTVYGGLAGVEQGLKQVIKQIGRKRDVNQTRYVINLLQIEKRLRSNRLIGEQLSAGIHEAQKLAEHMPVTHPSVVACLADTYQETISTLRPRVMVSGDPQLLQQSENAARIRALLLAGVRAAFLWNQCGGSRFKLLLQSARVVRSASQLLEKFYSAPS